MKVIIVGPDGSGKTTIVEGLKDNPLFRNYEFYKGSFADIGKNPLHSLELIKRNENSAVYDRWPIIDDFVYSEILGDKESPLEEKLDEVIEVLKTIKVIYVEADIEELKRRIGERGDEFVDEHDLENILEAYDKVFKKLKVSPFKVNTTSTIRSEIQDLVINHLKQDSRWKGIAHIVPIAGLSEIENDPLQMSLAQLVNKDKNYLLHYKREIKKGNFVIMDNGAFEGEDLSNEQLYQLYLMLEPTELVLKDILYGGEESFKVTEESYNFFKARNVKSKLMGVPQGKSLDEWCEQAKKVIDLGVDTIGIPRVLAKIDPNNRIRAAEFVRDYNLDVDIHLLGAAEDFGETKEVLESTNIRSMDTSLAYMLAQKETQKTSLKNKRPNSSIDFEGPFENKEEFLVHKEYMDKTIK